MKRKTNKTKEEAWSQTAHAPDGEQPGPEASDTSGQSVPKSKFRKKSQQEQAAAAKLHMESQGEKLEQAREKLAKQKPPKKPGPVKRIGRVASGSVHSFVHGKIFEVEQENVGTEGAHRSELVGETALRHGSRFVRRKVREHPAKVVRKAEARYTKYTADYHFHTAAQEHPELTKNALTRYWQKQRLRRQYRKQAKEAAKQGAATAGKTATATERLTARVVEFVKSHPAGAVVAVLCVLLLFAMQSCSSTMLMLGNAGAGALGASTYPCEDRDMLAAEAAYCALEDDLQHYLDTYESTHDYDEYHFDLDEIEHDPYVLLSLLCALHEGQWTIDKVQGTLQMLFDRQYILTEDVVVETRYRTETDTWTDEDGNSHTDTYQVPYDYYICTVTLENFDLSHVPVYVIGEDQLSRYAIYMATLGNRPDLFPDSPYVNKYITGKPGDYEVPGEYLDDETFAAMLAEAQKYIGYEVLHKLHPERVLLGTETRHTMLPDTMKFAKTHPYLIGDFVWTLQSHLGEINCCDLHYEENEEHKSYPWVTNHGGVLDLTGQAEPSLHRYEFIWGGFLDKPVHALYLASQPPVHNGKPPIATSYRWTDTVDGWTYERYEGKRTFVDAYTDADSVEIFVNGKSAGKAQVKDYFAKIPCIYEPGELVGVGYDADGQEIYRTSVRTADAETVLTVKTDKNILRAGGQDFCFADVYVTDKNGTVKLLPDYDVKIEVVGAASLQGYGSAAYKNAEHYDQHHHKSWQGHLQAVLRSTEKTGPVTVTFTADGCAPAILHLSAE